MPRRSNPHPYTTLVLEVLEKQLVETGNYDDFVSTPRIRQEFDPNHLTYASSAMRKYLENHPNVRHGRQWQDGAQVYGLFGVKLLESYEVQ